MAGCDGMGTSARKSSMRCTCMGGMVKGVKLRATCCTAWCSVSQSVPGARCQGKGCLQRGMPAMASRRCRQALQVGRGHAVDVQLRQGPQLCRTAPEPMAAGQPAQGAGAGGEVHRVTVGGGGCLRGGGFSVHGCPWWAPCSCPPFRFRSDAASHGAARPHALQSALAAFTQDKSSGRSSNSVLSTTVLVVRATPAMALIS